MKAKAPPRDPFPDGLFDKVLATDERREPETAFEDQSVAKVLEGFVVATDALVFVQNRARHLVSRARRFARPGGLLLTSDGGGGKTFICREVMKMFPREESPTSLSMPALYLRLKPRTTPNKLARLLLKELGHDGAVLNDDETLTDTVQSAFLDCGVHLLIFDEAHQLLPVSKHKRNESRLLGATGDWIKEVTDETRTGCIFSGTPALIAAFEADLQYSTRWPTKVHLEPYSYGTRAIQFLAPLLNALPFPENSSCLARQPAVVRAFCTATKGNSRDMVGLLGHAAECATERRAKSIDLRDLIEAFNRQYGFVENPFKGLQ
jgi:hypothetical protein